MNPSTNPNIPQAVSPFPTPPDYAQNYKTENMTNGQFSAFPPPPVQSVFTVFGEEYRLDDEIIRPLTSQGIRQIYPHKYDWKTEMKKLNSSVVAAFLDLVDMLIRCPDCPERHEKLNDIQMLFINMHHLVNEYRPLQARDTLRIMQTQQVKELELSVSRMRKCIETGREAMKDEFDMSDMPLVPVPQPSALSGITLTEDDVESVPVNAIPSAQIPVSSFNEIEEDSEHFEVNYITGPFNNINIIERKDLDFFELQRL